MALPELFSLPVSHRGVSKSILVYPGISVEEVGSALKASFKLGPHDEVEGITDARHVTYPLTLLSRAPSYFKDSDYQLALLDSDGEVRVVFAFVYLSLYFPLRLISSVFGFAVS